MLVTYLRSSAIGTLAMCETKYLFSYVLGQRDKANKKAIQGSAMHHVLELLALKKLALNNGEETVTSEIGTFTLDELDDIDRIAELSYYYYKNHEGKGLKWEDIDRKNVIKWCHTALAYNDGEMDPRNQNVWAAEEFFDFEVKKDWAKYSYTVGDETIEGYLRLRGTVDLITVEDEDQKLLHIQDYKGLPVDTPIPTPNGWSTMGDLLVGDIVFDQHGKQTRVTAKSTKKLKPCYKITFDDNSTATCDDEHYWTLHDGSVVQIDQLKVRDCINTSKPIECEEKDLPIDPYLLGMWLGDGRNRSCEITSGDPFVFEEIERRGYSLGVNQEKRHSNCESRTIKDTTGKLRELDLLNNKHIPNIYLRASFQQRLDLLRGLMDSDGSVNKVRKQGVFINCNEQLSRDVNELLLTLGQRPYLSKQKKTGFGINTHSYDIYFKPVNINPFLLPRKHDLVMEDWGPGRSWRRQVRKIEKVDDQITQCITVDSDDSTYLCTENFIPTHNSGRRWNWAEDKIKEHEDFYKDPQLLFYYYALRNKYPDYEFLVSIYYVNDHKIDGELVKGGLFTVVFDDRDYERAEDMIRQKFEYIRSVEIPSRIDPKNSHWKCRYLCKFSEIDEETGESTCQKIHRELQDFGLDAVTAQHADLSKQSVYEGGGKYNVAIDKDT